MTDSEYMKMALELAKKGEGRVSPNPMVGAVIVKDGRIIGRGYHEKYGSLHAERSALANCRESAEGADMYVTLEPCCHFGKQPPCTDAVIKAGISRVIIGSGDPNPLVGGKGIKILRENGVSITEHVLEDECRKLNEVFFHYISTKRPYVVMKYAMTLDGKIAAYTGKSQWITGEEARENVHRMRNKYSAIMVGLGTVTADNPMLTCRVEGGNNPVRIICDTNLRTPLSSNLAATAKEIPTIIACCIKDKARQEEYLKLGFKIIEVPEKNGHIDLNALMERLGNEGIDSILLEGGGTLNSSALESGIVQKVQAYISPKLLGGIGAKSPVGGVGFPDPDSSVKLSDVSVTRLGEDFLIEGRVI